MFYLLLSFIDFNQFDWFNDQFCFSGTSGSTWLLTNDEVIH